MIVETPVAETATEPALRHWSLATQIAFRFAFLYLGLYVLTTQMLRGLIPFGLIKPLGETGAVRSAIQWIAANIFGITRPLIVTGSGSGDKTYDWLLAFAVLTVAILGTALWSVLGTRREYVSLHKWFRLFVRFAFGTTMVSYGVAKVIPLQMPFPQLTRLLEPFGHFSPMGVLWYSIGASPAYEIFTGCVEIAVGVLLFIPATVTLGAILGLTATGQIFTLNMTYDVPVKLFSFHLVLFSLFLLAPDIRRLVHALVLNRTIGPSATPPLGGSRRARIIWTTAQIAFGTYVVWTGFSGSARAWNEFGGGAPKSPLYGIWNVDYMAIDGVERAPLVTDYDRWRRVVFDTPQAMAFQRMDDTFARFGNKIDEAGRRVTLTNAADRQWTAGFTFSRTSPDKLTLQGTMDGKAVEMRMTLFPREQFLLVSRGFNWIQEFPFNR